MSDDPKVIFTPQARQTIKDIVNESLESGLETGGVLVGTMEDGDYRVQAVIGPGENAVRTAGTFEKDPVHVANELVRLRAETGQSLKYLGEMHLHPVEGLSAGDKRTLRQAAREWPGFLAPVVNSRRPHGLRCFTAHGSKIVELEWTVEEAAPAVIDYARTATLFDASHMQSRSVLVNGCGSGASLVCFYLARAGVGRFFPIDPEQIGRAHV